MTEIVRVETREQLVQAKELFKEYATSLGFDLAFQNFDKEFAELPGDYASPEGRLLLALKDNEIVGCVGLRKYTPGICEMKRMYIREKFRGKGIGRKLAVKVIEEAKKIGYKEMRLDTVPWMKEAIALYTSLGFIEIEPYRFNPKPGSRYFSLKI
jgi:GNAT superfamily N-acetyltransferase